MNRKNNGQFKRKSKLKVVLNWIGVLIVIGLIAYIAHYTMQWARTIIPKDQVTEISKTSHTEECMKDAKCKARIENTAAQLILQREIDDKKRVYEATMNSLEQRMEELRKQELSLQ